jgi:uncharacterized protein YndB with AHSA1/START domain
MTDLAQYTPGPATGARVQKAGDRWTLILVRELHHSPEKVWRALTDPAHLHEWAPFDANGNLDTVGAVIQLTWTGTGQTVETRVTRAEVGKVLEYADIRWELAPIDAGTRLTLWHTIPQRYVSWGAAGWHIGIDVMDRLLAGHPIGRIAGGDVWKIEAWQKLVAEYSKQFGNKTDN